MKIKILLLLFVITYFCYSQDGQKWYQKPLRISALQCNFEEDTYAVIDKWSEMGFNAEQLFHPIADSYSAIYDAQKHKEILKRYIAKAHEKGIKIILYLNVHVLGPALDDKKDIWSQRNSKGEILKLYVTYPSICLNSSWKKYFFSVLDDLKEIDIDGIFLDGPVVIKPACFCDSCRAKYRRIYNSEIGNDSVSTWKFNALTRDEFLQSAYDRWKAANPDKIFYMNLPIIHSYRSFVNIENALKYNDIIGTEGGFMFYNPAKESFLYRTSFTAKLLESAAPEKPRVIFMAADNKPWNWSLHTPAETEICIAASIANASNIWYGLHGSTEMLKNKSALTAKDILLFAKKNEKFFDNTNSTAKVGLFFSFVNSLQSNDAKDESDFSKKSVREMKYGDTEDALRGWYSMLSEKQIPFDIISDLNLNLEKYDVVICPNAVATDEKTISAIKNFVKKGGRLISEGAFSLFNEAGEQKSNFGLADVFGIGASSGFTKHEPYNYFVFDTSIIKTANKYFPLPVTGWKVHANKFSKVIASALDDLKGRYVPLTSPNDPFIVYNKYEKGDSYYFSGNFGEMFNKYYISEYKNIIENIITEKESDRILFENNPAHLEIIKRRTRDELVVHLINYNGGPSRPMEEITPSYNIKIKLPESLSGKKVKSIKTDKYLSKEGDWFILPLLKAYDILVIN